MKNETEQNVTEKKASRRKYIIAAVCFVLLVIGVFTIAIIRWEPKPDPDSERIIREAVARQLGKDVNDLKDEDFASITTLMILEKSELSDIKLLEKFKNMERLELNHISYPESAIPKWIKILSKIGILDLNEKFSIDLSPIKNLTAMKTLKLRSNLFSDITPLKALINLETLDISNTRVSDLESLRGLTNLETLFIFRTQVSNLEPIMHLEKLRKFLMIDCPNITDQQLKNLRTAHPDLFIIKDEVYVD